MEKIYSQREAAERLGICRKTLRRWEREKVITPVSTTRSARLFNATDVEALAARLTPERVPFQSRLVAVEAASINNSTTGQCQ